MTQPSHESRQYAMSRHQEDARFAERRQREKFLAIVAPLKSAPDPRHIFDNVARRDNPTKPKGADLIAACQSAMDAALATGDRDVIEKVDLAILDMWQEGCAQSRCRSPLVVSAGIKEAECEAVRDAAAATAAIGEAGIRGTPSANDQAVRVATVAIRSLELVREELTHQPVHDRSTHLTAHARR